MNQLEENVCDRLALLRVLQKAYGFSEQEARDFADNFGRVFEPEAANVEA